MVDIETQRRVEQFLFSEAKLLDDGEFESWLGLYAPNAIYWIPSQPNQTDPKNVASIIYEDHAILSIRVQRLLEARALVLTPMPQTTHLLGNIEVSEASEQTIRASAAFVCIQHQAEDQKVFSGRQAIDLQREGDGFRITQKRVDLVNAGGVLPLITIPF